MTILKVGKINNNYRKIYELDEREKANNISFEDKSTEAMGRCGIGLSQPDNVDGGGYLMEKFMSIMDKLKKTVKSKQPKSYKKVSSSKKKIWWQQTFLW